MDPETIQMYYYVYYSIIILTVILGVYTIVTEVRRNFYIQWLEDFIKSLKRTLQ